VIAPPENTEVEAALLGAVLLAGVSVDDLWIEEGVRREHFHRPSHGLVWEAMAGLALRGEAVDVATVCAELTAEGNLEQAGGAHRVDALTGGVPVAGNARSYARIVVDLARWRRRLTAAVELQGAAQSRDEEAFIAAEGRLVEPSGLGQRRVSVAQAIDEVFTDIASGEDQRRFRWPFRRLNDLSGGGMRPAQVTLIAGPTSHGKSVMAGMVMESAMAGENPPRACVYNNEMTAREMAERIISRAAVVDHTRVASKNLTPGELESCRRAAAELRSRPLDLQPCDGWSPQDICRHARREGYELVCLDIVNRLPHRWPTRVRDLQEASTELNTLAKTTGAHVLVLAHVNRSRVSMDGSRPNPTLTDVRDCQSLADDANNVLFVWRSQDEVGDPTSEGVIRFAKARGAQLGGLEVVFDGQHQRFTALDWREAAAAA
jgi:replicative DNA helicase